MAAVKSSTIRLLLEKVRLGAADIAEAASKGSPVPEAVCRFRRALREFVEAVVRGAA